MALFVCAEDQLIPITQVAKIFSRETEEGEKFSLHWYVLTVDGKEYRISVDEVNRITRESRTIIPASPGAVEIRVRISDETVGESESKEWEPYIEEAPIVAWRIKGDQADLLPKVIPITARAFSIPNDKAGVTSGDGPYSALLAIKHSDGTYLIAEFGPYLNLGYSYYFQADNDADFQDAIARARAEYLKYVDEHREERNG